MYQKFSLRWFKHLDFIFLDLVCLVVAFFISYALRLDQLVSFNNYSSLLVSLLVIDIFVNIAAHSFKNVLKRGYFVEFRYTLRNAVFIFAFETLLLFAVKNSAAFSRIMVGVTGVLYIALSYLVRVAYKTYYKKYRVGKRGRSLLFITNTTYLPQLEEHLANKYFDAFRLAGVVCLDKNPEHCSLPVVADQNNVEEYVRLNWVDEVMLILPPDQTTSQLASTFMSMGITVHMGLDYLKDMLPAGQSEIEKIGGFECVTVSWNSMSIGGAILKRTIDILGGLVGALFTILLTIFIGPIIYITSPGPIFFKQERIGRNGKTFKMYKFRSMVMNADALKAQYMKENRVSDGMMFKLDWDPRIIGNKTLPDGTHKTGIGDFIRRTSLDEFPQFFNVLKGEMSLVGTRPPTLDEWVKYEDHHRARMAMKPGITGMWQISGRSDITDFEEVVRLDTEYIANWTPSMDIKILLKTVGVVLKHKGSM